MFSNVLNVNVSMLLVWSEVTQNVSRNEQGQVEDMAGKKEKRELWGVPVSEIRKDRCESHIILKDSGLRKRPKKCESKAVTHGIKWKGQEFWVCEECWKIISDSDLEWGERNGIKIFKEK